MQSAPPLTAFFNASLIGCFLALLTGCVYSNGIAAAYHGVVDQKIEGTPYSPPQSSDSALLTPTSGTNPPPGSVTIVVERVDGYALGYRASGAGNPLNPTHAGKPLGLQPGAHLLTLRVSQVDSDVGFGGRRAVSVGVGVLTAETVLRATFAPGETYSLTGNRVRGGFELLLWERANGGKPARLIQTEPVTSTEEFFTSIDYVLKH